MISNEMKFRQVFESYVMVGVPLLSVLIFILTPSHADDEILIRLNEFLDEYLFGNGYYKPSAYPLAAKVTNSFSVILSICSGIWIGIYRRKDVSTPIQHPFAGMFVLIVLTLLCIWSSMYPQQFSINPPRRSFGLTESFHNNPWLFMMLMIMKNMMIYFGFRIACSFTLFFLRRKQEYR